MIKDKKIGFIGAGNMGKAMIRGLLDSKSLSPDSIYASDLREDVLISLKDEYGINICPQDNKFLVMESDIIFLSVKPQIIDHILFEIKESVDEQKLIITIAAGVTTKHIEGYLDGCIRVVRAMPNTPALVLEAATALSGGFYSTKEDLDISRHIFSSLGKVVTVDEEQLDAVTGLSGSGPAYVFVIIEALSDAGVKMGLSRDVATTLAAQTVLGSAKLLLETGMHPGRLKDMVTSPGGTAIEGIHTLEEGGIRTNLINAVSAATTRSILLGKKLNHK